MGPGPDQFVLSRRAGEQLARQVRYVERQPRNRQPHRRRSVSRGGTSAAGIAILTSALNYGTTAGAGATLYVGTPGSETAGDAITVYPWKLLPGDSIPANTQIDVAEVNGHWYLRNAACGTNYSS